MQYKIKKFCCQWLWLYLLLAPASACKQSGDLKSAINKADEKTADAKKDSKTKAPDEKVTPPVNVLGSYLVCQELEQMNDIKLNARLACGLYEGAEQALVPIASLKQWDVTGRPEVIITPVQDNDFSRVEFRLQATDINALKALVRDVKISVQDNNGQTFANSVGAALPATDRLATINANKTGQWVSIWNEGFEGTNLTSTYMLFRDLSLVTSTISFDWASPTIQTPTCGSPTFEILKAATQGGALDPIGAAEGQQFIDTDTACWPAKTTDPFRGPSNLSISKVLQLEGGRNYRISFKVRAQPVPPGMIVEPQGLQLRINGIVLKEIVTFTANWQEIALEWVATKGPYKVDWIDIGVGADSIGVLMDDLRLQIEEY